MYYHIMSYEYNFEKIIFKILNYKCIKLKKLFKFLKILNLENFKEKSNIS